MKAMCFIVLAASLALATGSAHASCPTSNPDSVYVNNANGTVTDLRSGLMWNQCVEGESGSSCSGTASAMHWLAALAVAQSSTYAGFEDWRLPNTRELLSLVEFCNFEPAINGTYFPGAPSAEVWSSSPGISAPGLPNNGSWFVNFLNGATGHSFAREYDNYSVRLVRAGQSYGDLIFKNRFDGGG